MTESTEREQRQKEDAAGKEATRLRPSGPSCAGGLTHLPTQHTAGTTKAMSHGFLLRTGGPRQGGARVAEQRQRDREREEQQRLCGPVWLVRCCGLAGGLWWEAAPLERHRMTMMRDAGESRERPTGCGVHTLLCCPPEILPSSPHSPGAVVSVRPPSVVCGKPGVEQGPGTKPRQKGNFPRNSSQGRERGWPPHAQQRRDPSDAARQRRGAAAPPRRGGEGHNTPKRGQHPPVMRSRAACVEQQQPAWLTDTEQAASQPSNLPPFPCPARRSCRAVCGPREERRVLVDVWIPRVRPALADDNRTDCATIHHTVLHPPRRQEVDVARGESSSE